MLSLIGKYLCPALLAVALICALSSAASNNELTERQRIAAAVSMLQPSLAPIQADAIGLALTRVSDEESCGVPWQVLLSIAYQESSLRKSAIGRLNPSTRDYGLMQINAGNVRRLGLDRRRLMTDLAYNLRAGCHILREMRDAHGDRDYWVGLYRAGTRLNRPVTIRIAMAYHHKIMTRAARLGYNPSRLAER